MTTTTTQEATHRIIFLESVILGTALSWDPSLYIQQANRWYVARREPGSADEVLIAGPFETDLQAFIQLLAIDPFGVQLEKTDAMILPPFWTRPPEGGHNCEFCADEGCQECEDSTAKFYGKHGVSPRGSAELWAGQHFIKGELRDHAVRGYMAALWSDGRYTSEGDRELTEWVAGYRAGAAARLVGAHAVFLTIAPADTEPVPAHDGAYVARNQYGKVMFSADTAYEATCIGQRFGIVVSTPDGVTLAAEEEDPRGPVPGERVSPLAEYAGTMRSTDPVEIAGALARVGSDWLDLRREAAELAAERPRFRSELVQRIKKDEGVSLSHAREAVKEHPAYLAYQRRCAQAEETRDEAEIVYNSLSLRGWALVGRTPPAGDLLEQA